MKKKYLLVGIGIILVIILVGVLFFLKTLLYGKVVPFLKDSGSQPAACSVKEIDTHG